MTPSRSNASPERGPLDPFPMQDGPPIPWFLAAVIHEHLYRHSQPLEQVARRGGFGWDEVGYMWGLRSDPGIPRHGTTQAQRDLCSRVVRESLEKLATSLRLYREEAATRA